MNQALIARRTQEVVALLDIGDQVAGLTTRETLINIGIRLNRLSSPSAKKMAAECIRMADRA